MNLLDIIILVLLVLGFINGFRRGAIKQGVLTIGIFLVVILAFIFKNPLSIMLYKKLPFFTTGILKNYSILNILLYELLSFLILLVIFSLIFAIISKISGIVEKLVRSTIILALPSRLIGGLFGLIEVYIFTFIVLLIITMPIFSVSKSKEITNSSMKNIVLNKSLVLSNVSKGIVKSINEVNDLIKSKNKLGTEEFNCKALEIFKENKAISKESIDYLKSKKKINDKCK
ncbi:MAG: CvpA family protein [Bacilli bacterium]|nr:CvpA family protein [Bacilli bacterium]